jgi:hypothetical protein
MKLERGGREREVLMKSVRSAPDMAQSTCQGTAEHPRLGQAE